MSDQRAFPADGYRTGWTTWDGADREELTLTWENEGWTAAGRVGRERVEYVVRLSPLWQVRQFLLFRDLSEPDLWLGTDGQGRWGEMNGAHRPELDGAHDLALDVTPFTASLPIRRLPHHVGDAFTVPVVTVDVETLAVGQRRVEYRRLAARRWSISRVAGRDDVEVDVDEFGLLHDVDAAFRRA